MAKRILRALVIVLLASTIQVHAQKIERLLEFDRGLISALHATDNVIIVGRSSSVYISKPDGSWTETEFPTNIPNTEVLSVYAISPDSLLASVTGLGFVLSSDGGLTWQTKPSVVPLPNDILYLGDNTIVGNTYQGIYKSFDFGESWHPVSGPYSQNPNSTFLAHISDSVLVAGTSAGLEDFEGDLFYSWDAGTSWIDSTNVISNGGGGPARFAAEHEGKIVLFRDYVTEVIIPFSGVVESSYPIYPPHSFAQGEDRFFGSFWRDDLELSFSDDGGTTWISTGYTVADRANLFAPSDSILYVRGFSGSSMYLDKLSFSIATSVEPTAEYDNESELELFPNPARDVLTVRFNHSAPPRSASVFSIDGKSLLIIQREDLSDGEVTVDTSRFPSGTYFLRVDYEFNSIYRSFVTVR